MLEVGLSLNQVIHDNQVINIIDIGNVPRGIIHDREVIGNEKMGMEWRGLVKVLEKRRRLFVIICRFS